MNIDPNDFKKYLTDKDKNTLRSGSQNFHGPNALRTCPFCGGLPKLFLEDSTAWVSCVGCDADGPVQKSEIDARNSWNTRF